MTVTAGTDKPVKEKPSYNIVMFYLTKPKELEIKYPGISREEYIKIEPYFFYEGKEVKKESLSVTTSVHKGPDSINVMIIGNPKKISVGFRVTELVKKEVLFMSFKTQIVATSNKSEKNLEVEGENTIGMWLDPVITL